jgi:hypothetical protein
MGMSPEQWRSQAIQNETQKLAVHAAKPAAVSATISTPIIYGYTFELSPTWILKGPDEGSSHLFFKVAGGPNITSTSGVNVGFNISYLKGDERNFYAHSLTKTGTDLSLGYKNVNATYSYTYTPENDKIESYGLEFGIPKTHSGPVKLEKLNISISGQKSYTFDVLEIFSGKYKDPKLTNTSKEPTNHYYLRTYTNFPLNWYENK